MKSIIAREAWQELLECSEPPGYRPELESSLCHWAASLGLQLCVSGGRVWVVSPDDEWPMVVVDALINVVE